MSVAQFDLDPLQGKVTAGFGVARHTMLHAKTKQGQECRFRTAWDTVLWPIQVVHAEIDMDAVLRVTLQCSPGTDFSELEIDTLRIHLKETG